MNSRTKSHRCSVVAATGVALESSQHLLNQVSRMRQAYQASTSTAIVKKVARKPITTPLYDAVTVSPWRRPHEPTDGKGAVRAWSWTPALSGRAQSCVRDMARTTTTTSAIQL